GPGLHPYHHAATEASASVDMLKAAMQYCNSAPDIKAKPNGSLYLEGYSQGGHAALATQEELQRNPVPGLILQKTVAGSGAYSLSLVQKNFVFDHADYASPSFLPYLLLGYQEVYGNMYGNLNQVFVQPYSTAMPGLFDGSLTVNEINLQLPAQWQSMFNPTYLWNLRYSYLHPVNSALRKNDLINWKPQSDLHLYYCTCDELVDNNNSLLAYLSFILKGSNRVTTAPLGPFKHAECAPFVMLLAKVKFDCDSHANPCGINLLSLLKSDTDDELVQFSQAMEESYQAPAVEDLLQDNILASYLSQEIPQEKNKLHVYPNPANDIVNVQLSSEMAGKAIISLFDMQGRRIREENYTGNLMIIDVKPLPAGIYKVVVSGDINLSQTLVVSK
ncbi:MAG TPA: T9SS type A sorting domain-containing protein, partial [Bacteroidales bacterium]|nr:T9SS type A sorting domain-containing protein [Bacteroidales bacterium]